MIKKVIALGVLLLGLSVGIGQAKVIYPFDIDLKGHDLENVGSIDASTVDIDGGTIDDTAIGGTTPSTGSFTDLSCSGAFSLTGDEVQDDEVSDDITIDNTTSVTTDGAVTAGGTSKITFTPAGGEITTTGNGDILLNPAGTGIVKTSKKIHGTSSLWWYIKYVDAFTITPGGSGAQLITPDANTLGGYQLDADTEKLYFNAHIFDNWDASSDLELVVVFEVNVDNTAGADTDTVDLKVVSYYKGDGETTNKTQTTEVATTVGKSPQYKQFTATFTIDYDATDNVVEVGDTISFILNLETDTSEVDNIIVNSAIFRYRSIAINPET